MTLEQLNKLKALSESLESGDVSLQTINELSKVINKLQDKNDNEINYNRSSFEAQ